MQCLSNGQNLVLTSFVYLFVRLNTNQVKELYIRIINTKVAESSTRSEVVEIDLCRHNLQMVFSIDNNSAVFLEIAQETLLYI